MANVQSLDVNPRGDVGIKTGMDIGQTFDELVSQPFASEPSVAVEGDWVVMTQASQAALLEHTAGVQVVPDKQPDEGEQLVTTQSTPSGLEADFGSGDATVTVGIGSGYYINNEGYSNDTAIYHGGNVVLEADAGSKSFTYTPPEGQLLELVGQFPFGYQFQALGVLLKNLPQMGVSEAWKVPAVNTEDGAIALAAPYSYGGARAGALPRAFAQFQADITVDEDTTVTISVRQNDGSKATESQVDLQSGTTTATVAVLGPPSSGIVEYTTDGVPFTVSNTSIFPPV